jgi:hypothetical protein
VLSLVSSAPVGRSHPRGRPPPSVIRGVRGDAAS